MQNIRSRSRNLRTGARVFLSITLFGFCSCSKGHIENQDSSEVLRTAWFDVRPGTPTETRILLSNSDFECLLPAWPDPIARARSLEEWWIAACREDAVHVFLTLRTDGDPTVGVYSKNSEIPNVSASSFQVDEAERTATGLHVTAMTFDADLGTGLLSIRNSDAEHLSGSLDYDLWKGDFAANRCKSSPGPSVLDVLVTSDGVPALVCP